MLAFISIGAVAFLSLGIAAYLEFGRFSPEAEWKRMLSAMGKVETASYSAAVGWSRLGNDPMIAAAYAAGDVRWPRGAAPENASRFHAIAYGKNIPVSDLSGELREVGGVHYLTYAPPGPVGTDAFKAPDRWLSFDAANWLAWGAVLPGLDVPGMSADFSFPDWSSASAGRVRSLLSRADLLRFSYGGDVEKGPDEDERVIDARVDASAADAFLLDLVRARTGQEPDDHDRAVAQQAADAFSRLSVKLWIGSKTHRLYRIHATGTAADQGNDPAPFDARLDLKDFGKPVVISVPDHVTAFKAAVPGSLPTAGDASLAETTAPLAQAHLPATAGSNDPDGDGLDNLLEAFYGTDPNNPDTDHDGVSDGKEVVGGRNPRGAGTLFSFGL